MIQHKPVYEFHSVFASSIYKYLALKEALGEKITSPGNILRQFDRYCMSIDLQEPILTLELAENWFLTKADEKQSTRSHRVSALWCFARHFSAEGGEVTWKPNIGYAGRQNRYVPYIYTKAEVKNIFAAADAMPKSCKKSRFNVIFPAIIRALYGCGLRISEALALKVKDVDLENGFIFVYIEIDRVTDRKSLVDVRMTASVVTDFYRNGVTSFIIVSSDSDYWGLIESLPDANFLVMYEYEKCGSAIKNALAQHGIYYCAIDDFCTAGTEDMKRAVLFAELEKHLPSLVGENPLDLTHKIYEATRVTATMKEMENFCNRYVKTLRLKVNSEGKFEIEIQK